MAKSTTTKTKKQSETPLMQQYYQIKEKYPGALVLFRVGDFYETFSDDAVKTSEILGIVLTKRANGSASHVALAGFPHHSLDTYLPKLVRAGQRVAICDQLENPSKTKKIVKRGVTQVVTPGVSYNDNILNQKNNNFLAAVYEEKGVFGISFLDISTGEFLVSQGNESSIDKLLQTFKPKEVLFKRSYEKTFVEKFGKEYYTFKLDDWIFGSDFAEERITTHFNTKGLKGFGIEGMTPAITAAGASLHYIHDTHHDNLSHISTISRIEDQDYVWLDRFTIRNLELIHPNHPGGKALIDVIDQCHSPMGSRLLKNWVVLPLKNKSQIEDRLALVECFHGNGKIRDFISQKLKEIGDLERLISKVALGKVTPREIVHLKRALNAIEEVKDACLQFDNKQLNELGEKLNPCLNLRDSIERKILDEPAVLISKGGVFMNGVSAELDDLRSISTSGKDYLLDLQKREVERTGISSLKVAFNNVFGYYLEVSNRFKDSVPEEWIRKQTLVNAERYITEELKVYEEKILGAEDKILQIEASLYEEMLLELMEFIQPVQINARILAKLDCLRAFADVAITNKYVKPSVSDNNILQIKEGRHPVIEQELPIEESYIPNDVYLDSDQQQILIITGPNMSGKSAALRQCALITLMAQIGSFVPAKSADIGIVDKIFTRVGASDNISSGESTFMVEMNETASILNNISDKSLVLLDEIGRGTSTFDGISIAWSIVEFLHDHPLAKAKTLFATHYHELNELTKQFDRVKNFNVSMKEVNKKMVFLRKLEPGGSEHSFGIQVAQMAGMPFTVVEKAQKVLATLESQRGDVKSISGGIKEDLQLSFFQLDDPRMETIKEMLQNLNLNALTPIDAMMKLNEIQKIVKDKK
ncbi:MAG: DNA mismatch repair protein MutS [Sphingobacteriales bacterium]